jgi:hypothetical protein
LRTLVGSWTAATGYSANMSEEWAPDSCTLPSAERPLRVAEFDDLFASVLRSERPEGTRLELVIPRALEASARDLARRESQCCSFFSFGFETAGDDVLMRVSVPPPQVGVLDALATRVGLTLVERAQSQ